MVRPHLFFVQAAGNGEAMEDWLSEPIF